MQRENLATWGVAALAGALIIAGLAVVGGPETARAEQRDRARLAGLREIAACLRDMPRDDLAALPAEMPPRSRCSTTGQAAKLLDDNAVRFELLSGPEFKLCTRFELPDRLPRHSYQGEIDPQSGCLGMTLAD